MKKKIHYTYVFLKIIKKSKLIYLFLLFIILYIIFSAAIYYYDKEAFANFGDTLWFTFSSIFTVGYGDYSVHTPLSRILTTILIIYGTVIVAIFTAVWVNLVSIITKATVFEEDEKRYEQLCNLDNLDKSELKKLASFFKKNNIK